MKRIGLHLRLKGRISDLVRKAVQMELPFFQCFFIIQGMGKAFFLSENDYKEFLPQRSQFDNLFVHGSYWINLASWQMVHRTLERELRMAKRLQFTHIILHAGSAKGLHKRTDGIDAMARTLNATLKRERDVKIVLENVAHAAWSIGGDFQDFKLLLEKLDQPDNVSFCVDTAHAYSFGYDFCDDAKREAFVALLDATIGIDRIALIHLNDTAEKCGSHIDRHCAIGSGAIGDAALKNVIAHPRLMHVPVVLEMPELPEEQELALLKKVREWNE